MAVVKHRSSESGEGLLNVLRSFCPLTIEEVEDKQPIMPEHVYLAPASYHLLVDGRIFTLDTQAHVSYARPPIDVLFESAAIAYRERLVGVVLTGANKDGSEGARQIKARGGVLIVQDPQTAENPIMPAAVFELVAADHILKLEQTAPFLNRCSMSR